MDLVEFLRARHEDEAQLARRAETGQQWQAITDGSAGPIVEVGAATGDEEWSRECSSEVWHCDDEQDGCPEVARGWIAEAKHIARHDPARVLRDVEARRRIVDACEETLAGEDRWDPQLEGGSGEEFELARFVLRMLALLDADHADYDPAWAPASVG